MDILSDISCRNVLAPEPEIAASRRVYANFQYSWSKRTMLALVDSSQTIQRNLQRHFSMSENSSCTSCDLYSETSTDFTTPTSTCQAQEDLVFRRKQSIKRTYAFNELIDTERVYVNDLRVMVETYFSAMQKQKWILQEDVRTITRNVNDILSLHIKLLEKLEACSQNFHWENVHNRYCQLADVFVTMGPSFIVYAEFCGLHANASKVCASYQAKPEWASFSKMCLSDSDGAPVSDDMSTSTSASIRLHLDDYLIKPVQRICRYQLLIKEILKSTDPASSEYDKLKAAYDIMQNVVTSVDERKNQTDLADRSQLFLDRLDDDWRLSKSFVSSLGNLSMSGAMEVTYAADGLPATKTRYMGCFLYSTYMIIVKAKKQNTYEAKHWFPISIFEVKDLPDAEGFAPASFMIVSNGHVFEFSTSCHQEKILWMKLLRANITSSQLIIDESSRTDKIERIVPISFYYKSGQPRFALRTSKSQSSITLDTNAQDPSTAPIRRSRSITVQCSKSTDNIMFSAGYHSMSFDAKPCLNTTRRSSVDQIFRSRSLLKRMEVIESNYTIELLSTTSSLTESTVEHIENTSEYPGTNVHNIKRISQTRLAQPHSIKVAIDQKFYDVCTQDYLSSRAWYARERSAGVTLRKRKSLPFIRTSPSNMSLNSTNMKRRTSDVGHPGRQNPLDKVVSEIPLDDYVAFQKSLVTQQRAETARRPSLTCLAIKNNWSRISGTTESKLDESTESNPPSPTEASNERGVAPWEQVDRKLPSSVPDVALYETYPSKTAPATKGSMATAVKQTLEVDQVEPAVMNNVAKDADDLQRGGRRISKSLNVCKPKRTVSAPLSPKSQRSTRKSHRSASLLVPKSMAPVKMSEIPNQVPNRSSLPPLLRRDVEISQPTSFAYSSTPPSTPRTSFFDSSKLRQMLWWK